MKKNAIKIIQDNKISADVVNQTIHKFIENHIIKNKSRGILNIKKHIQSKSEEITTCFIELVQLNLDSHGKAYDEATTAQITINYQLFKAGFKQIMQQTKYGFYEFIHGAWHHILINLRDETDKEDGNKRNYDLSLALLEEINIAYGYAVWEKEQEFPTIERL
jgi:hypothetical protein